METRPEADAPSAPTQGPLALHFKPLGLRFRLGRWDYDAIIELSCLSLAVAASLNFSARIGSASAANPLVRTGCRTQTFREISAFGLFSGGTIIRLRYNHEVGGIFNLSDASAIWGARIENTIEFQPISEG